MPLKRKEIARMINISPQYVSELLTELVEEGVLRRNSRELIIVDQSGLWHEIDFEELILNH
jgi:predicted transcriptional regulator